MNIIDGNIFDAKADAIMHQCNCFCIWEDGFSIAMKDAFPELHEADKNTGASKWKFGSYSYAEITRYNSMGVQWAYNLYGQVNYGYHMRMTGYPEFERAFMSALSHLDKKFPSHCEIAVPYLIGCGLAGGDEKIITQLIDRSLKKFNGKFHLTAYRNENS